jgi:hypothetical protein
MRVNDAAVLALSSDPDVYARGTTLVQVQRSRIRELPEAVLREHMASSAEWLLFNKTDQTFVPAHPPDWSVKAVFRRGLWSGMRDLAGVVTYPTLLTDGRVLTTPGYDAESKLLYLPDDDWTDMPESPTIDDARAAVRLLTEVVSQFPFEAPIDRAAWLSELLTVVGRHAIIGPFPMFVHTANLKGTGKGKLVQCVSIIATGCQVEEAALPTTEEEREKRMAGVSLSGRPLYLFDEVTEISGATLQMVATSRQFSGRVLGVTGDYRGPMDTVFALTGNNVTVGGDMNRRIVVSRLLTTEEKPWQRTGFDHESLLEYVMRERKGLLIAALTILRAYVLAGRPRQRVGAFGSYEAWTALIASALVWVDQPDVTATTNGMDVDPDALHLDALLTAWSAVFGAQPLLAGDLIEFAETGTRPGETPVIDMEDTSLPDEPPSHAATLPTARSTPIRDPRAVFVAALCDFCPPRPPAKLPASTTLGNRLKVAKSRVVGGRRLLSGFDAHRKQQLWRVESLVASGAGVAGGSAPEHPQATTQRNHVSAGSAGSAGIVSPTRERIQVPPRRQENERLIAEALDGLDSRTREDPQHPHAAEITVPKHAGSPRDGNKATPATPAADALVRDQARSASAPHTPPTAGTPNVSVTDSELAGMFDAFEGRPHDDRAEHEARVDEAEPTHKYPALKVPAYVADLLDCL